MDDRRKDACSDNLSGVETGAAVRKPWPDPCLTWLARAQRGAAGLIPSIGHRASRRSVGRSYKRKREKKQYTSVRNVERCRQRKPPEGVEL
jgi:hypothetical protein